MEKEILFDINQNPVDAIMQSIPKVGPKSLEECIELGKRIEAGKEPDGKLTEDAKAARDELVYSCAGLNLNLASKYSQRTGIPTEELLMEGFTGLQKAASAYDYKRGFKFVTLAKNAVGWEIVRRIRREFKFSREISLTDHESEQEYLNDESKDTPLEQIEDKNALQRDSLEDQIDLSLLGEILVSEFDKLTDKQKKALILHFGEDLPLSQCGREEGRKRQGIKSREERALARLRKKEVIEKLRPYLHS